MKSLRNNLLIELEYGSTDRPIDAGINSDKRELAIRFCKIKVVCTTTNESVGEFDFKSQTPAGVHILYGLDAPEQNGPWSIGRSTAILLSLQKPASSRVKIEISHEILQSDDSKLAYVRVNKGEERSVVFAGGIALLEVDLFEQPTAMCVLDHGAKPSLSIIMLNFERPDLVFTSVVSILSSNIKMPFEILVVDNGGSKDAFSLLTEMGLPIRILRLEDRRSIAAANNIGVENAKGEFFLLLSNDAFVTEGVVEALLAETSDRGVGIVGPAFRHPDGSLRNMGASVTVSGNIDSSLSNGLTWDAPNILDVDYIPAACWLIRQSDFLEAGGFDPEFEHASFYDVEFCLRLQVAGKRTRLVKSAIVIRIQGATAFPNDQGNAGDGAYFRNQNILRSRWGKWLLTRDKVDAPKYDATTLNDLQRQIAQFPAEKLHCVFAPEPLTGDANSQSLIAQAIALSASRPTMIVSQTRYAVLDISMRARAMGLSPKRLTTGAPADIKNRDIDIAMVSSANFPNAPPVYGRHRVLHCPFPVVPDDIDLDRLRRRIGGLLNFDVIQTDSEYSRHACLELLNLLGSPLIGIDVAFADIKTNAVEDTNIERRNIIISMGPLRPGPMGGKHHNALRAFKEFYSAARGQKWRLVIAGYLPPDDGVEYVNSLRESASDLDVDVLVDPAHALKLRLFSRSKIFLSVQGLGADTTNYCSISDRDVSAAIAAGCTPVVFEKGAEAEFCAAEGVGLRFGDETDLLNALKEAAGLSIANVRSPDSGFREARQRGTVEDLIARTASDSANENFDTNSEKKPALVIVGMHRSGTSAMTRALSIAGADLPGDIMLARADNPVGFWEPAAIVDLNENILKSRNSSWDNATNFVCRAQNEYFEEHFFQTAIDYVHACFAGNRPIVLKDPRISVLIPFWDKVLKASGYQPTYVAMVRDPREVAASLASRNEIPEGKALLLWSVYMVSIGRDAQNAQVTYVAFEDLLNQPAAVIENIQKKSGVVLPKSIHAAHQIADFVQSDLRHHRIDEPWRSGKGERIRDYYYALLRASRGEGLMSDAHEELRDWLNDILPFIQ